MFNLLSFLDSTIFCILLIGVVYLFVFAYFAMKKPNIQYRKSNKLSKIAVFFPAYKEDSVIIDSISSFLKQSYPKNLYQIILIADGFKESTLDILKELPIQVLAVNFTSSTKAKALNYAVEQIKDTNFEIAVILDADNKTDANFLADINDAFCDGIKAIQAHRVAANLNSDTAVLDAVSEEINNSIFRRGHVRAGFSSALIGSGMAFSYDWFKDNIKLTISAGEDKELEKLLLKQGIYIAYLPNTFVYDQKVANSKNFYKQRRRWMAAQLDIMSHSTGDFVNSLLKGNWDYANKIFQWMMLPRVILLALIILMTALISFIEFRWAIKWWGLLFLFLITMAMALPDNLVDKKFKRAMRHIPILAIYMILNLFRLKGVNKKFIHTEH